MQFFVWLVVAMALGLWSATIWLMHAAMQLILTTPWHEALQTLQKIELPAILKPIIEPWLGQAWKDVLRALLETSGPLLQWLSSLLQDSSASLTNNLSMIAWILWAIGTFALLTMAALSSATIFWIRRSQLTQESVKKSTSIPT